MVTPEIKYPIDPFDPFGIVSKFIESARNLAARYPDVAAETAIQRGRTRFYVVVEEDRPNYLAKRFPTPEKAVDYALKKTIKNARGSTDRSVVIVRLAYGPLGFTIDEQGRRRPVGVQYLGGDAWTECPDKIDHL